MYCMLPTDKKFGPTHQDVNTTQLLVISLHRFVVFALIIHQMSAGF